MKKTTAKQSPRLDKHLYESGLQCQKRLWLDAHEPVEAAPSLTRQQLAELGTRLVTIAKSAFPKGIEVAGRTAPARAQHTKDLLAAGEPVVLGAAFLGERTQCEVDIVVQHKDGRLDLFEVKSGTKVKLRYLTDMALQVATVESAGFAVRAAFLLHVQPKYAHKEGVEFPPMQLLRSSDVTQRVRKLLPSLQARLDLMQKTLVAAAAPTTPMGSQCATPLRCPRYDACARQAPPLSLHELPDLNRKLEKALRADGAPSLREIDPNRAELSHKQRRTVAAVQQGSTIVEPFVKQELRDSRFPLHFVSIASVTEPLPRFDGQRPWRHVPFGWAANTLHEDGRMETAGFFFAEKGDPRREFLTGLAKQVECGGTIVCWNDRGLTDLRELLEDLPDAKEAARTILGRSHLDLMHLFDAGVFHPALRGHRQLQKTVAAVLPTFRPGSDAALDEEVLKESIERMNTPRSRKQTRDKIAADLQASLHWCSDALLAMFRTFGEIDPKPKAVPRPAVPLVAGAPKKLPKPLPGQ